MDRKPIEKVCRILLISLIASSGCVAGEPLDVSSYDLSHDQKAIAGYYRGQAVVMREKAHAQATAATRYEALFGSEASQVSGARSLAYFYEQTAEEFERLAEAHESVGRARQRPTTVP